MRVTRDALDKIEDCLPGGRRNIAVGDLEAHRDVARASLDDMHRAGAEDVRGWVDDPGGPGEADVGDAVFGL